MKFAVALLLAIATPTFAQELSVKETPLANPLLEAKARDLMHELRCLQCQNQSIADSHAPQAETMRQTVRERIAAGEEPEAVRDWFVERYGDWVTFTPPARSDTALLWAAPLLLTGLGAFVALRLFRK